MVGDGSTLAVIKLAGVLRTTESLGHRNLRHPGDLRKHTTPDIISPGQVTTMEATNPVIGPRE